MKFLRRVFYGALLVATPLFVSAYDDDTTHRALTDEIVKFLIQDFRI